MNEHKVSGKNIDVALFRATDAQDVSRIVNDSYEKAFGSILAQDDLRSHRARLNPGHFEEAVLHGDIIYIAKQEGLTVGMVQFSRSNVPELNPPKGSLELDKLYISPDMQGKGVGRALLQVSFDDSMISSAPALYLLVWKENKSAIRLYENFDFHPVGVRRFPTKYGHSENIIMMRLQS